jgi:hypothetical protein
MAHPIFEMALRNITNDARSISEMVFRHLNVVTNEDKIFLALLLGIWVPLSYLIVRVLEEIYFPEVDENPGARDEALRANGAGVGRGNNTEPRETRAVLERARENVSMFSIRLYDRELVLYFRNY